MSATHTRLVLTGMHLQLQPQNIATVIDIDDDDAVVVVFPAVVICSL